MGDQEQVPPSAPLTTGDKVILVLVVLAVVVIELAIAIPFAMWFCDQWFGPGGHA